MQVEVDEFETGAIRDKKEVKSAWHTLSLPVLLRVASLCKDDEFNNWKEYSPLELVEFAIEECLLYMSSKRDRPHLTIAFRHLMYACHIFHTTPAERDQIRCHHHDHGHVSTASNHLHLLPYHPLKLLAETRYYGDTKYGLWNWLYGFPITNPISHGLEHMWAICFGMTDEDHWGHGLCNLMFAIHYELFRPDLIVDLLNPDYTLTPEIEKKLALMHQMRLQAQTTEGPTGDRLRQSGMGNNPTNPYGAAWRQTGRDLGALPVRDGTISDNHYTGSGGSTGDDSATIPPGPQGAGISPMDAKGANGPAGPQGPPSDLPESGSDARDSRAVRKGSPRISRKQDKVD